MSTLKKEDGEPDAPKTDAKTDALKTALIQFKCPETLHRAAKIHAAILGVTIREVCEEALTQYLREFGDASVQEALGEVPDA